MSMKFKNPIEVDGYVSAEYADLSTTTTHAVNAGEIAWDSTEGIMAMQIKRKSEIELHSSITS